MRQESRRSWRNIVCMAGVILACGGSGRRVGAAGEEAGQPKNGRMVETPLLCGWHDELNARTAPDWQWQWPLGHADVTAPRTGILRLTLGDRAQPDRAANSKTYYWAAAARYADVDLDVYPILAVRAPALHGASTWWDITVNEYLSGDQHGPDRGATARPATKPGLILFDVAQASGLTGKKQLRIRLNVAGLEKGGWADYAYVRFIRREDARRLLQNPDLQSVVP